MSGCPNVINTDMDGAVAIPAQEISMTRKINCITGEDSQWIHDGRKVFIMEKEKTGFDMCVEAINERQSDDRNLKINRKIS